MQLQGTFAARFHCRQAQRADPRGWFSNGSMGLLLTAGATREALVQPRLGSLLTPRLAYQASVWPRNKSWSAQELLGWLHSIFGGGSGLDWFLGGC